MRWWQVKKKRQCTGRKKVDTQKDLERKKASHEKANQERGEQHLKREMKGKRQQKSSFMGAQKM